jgi:hypothetical protein
LTRGVPGVDALIRKASPVVRGPSVRPPEHGALSRSWGVSGDRYGISLRRFKSEVQQCSIDGMAE